ncbi:UAA transporter [Atractiella rhizophila]|nr:UAA transporter [Atractiella rhizophila]
MTLAKLAICVSGIYGSFLLWALLQERISTTSYAPPGEPPEYFRAVVFLNSIQSTFCCIAALLYLASFKHSSQNIWELLGLPSTGLSNKSDIASQVPRSPLFERKKTKSEVDGGFLSNATGEQEFTRMHGGQKDLETPSTFLSFPKNVQQFTLTLEESQNKYWFQRYPFNFLGHILKVSILQSIGPIFGFASLRYISFPTMILGKSCKLIPVMLMNIILYRRKFAAHKYAVVAIVTSGISVFMLMGEQHGTGEKRKGAESSSLLGIILLLINLIIDGSLSNQFWVALEFIQKYPSVLRDLLLFSLFGALGQIFIFLTLANFGSLTLVTITVLRKLFTMILSVFIYHHDLSAGQWGGVTLVFAGIAIEAYVAGGKKDGQGESMAHRVLDEKEKARLKDA